jgi:ectoine hydroxylase-related dioxygenase (phytanoyl-CoA dioxygenase family)
MHTIKSASFAVLLLLIPRSHSFLAGDDSFRLSTTLPSSSPSSKPTNANKPTRRQSSLRKEKNRDGHARKNALEVGSHTPDNHQSNCSATGLKSRSRTPNLQIQLQYARKGHSVLRNWLETARLVKLRQTLIDYGKEQELLAWKQKVQVASNDAKLASSCRTVKQCRRELDKLLGVDTPLPFLQYFHVWRNLSDVHQLAKDLAPTAGKLLDVDAVRLYQDALFWKRPGDGPTPWHTDARMAPFDTNKLITLWIPLQTVPKDGTGLVYVSESHNDFSLAYWHDVSDATENPNSPWNDLESRYTSPLVDYMPLAVGDVTAHAGWTLHCANGNDAGSTYGKQQDHEDRLALAISYVDAAAPVREKALLDNRADNEDLWSYQDWVRQVPSGQANFVHKKVPILWSKGTVRKDSKR